MPKTLKQAKTLFQEIKDRNKMPPPQPEITKSVTDRRKKRQSEAKFLEQLGEQMTDFNIPKPGEKHNLGQLKPKRKRTKRRKQTKRRRKSKKKKQTKRRR